MNTIFVTADGKKALPLDMFFSARNTSKTRRNGSRQGGFSLIELLVVVAIIGILAALLMPVIRIGLNKSREATKMGNLRQMWQANMIYTQNNDEEICLVEDGSGNDWRDLLADHMEASGEGSQEKIFVDPLFRQYDPATPKVSGYGMNAQPLIPESTHENSDSGDGPVKIHQIEDASFRMFIGDVHTGWSLESGNYESRIDTTRHRNKGLFLMFDGGIRFLDAEQAKLSFSDPENLDP